MRDLNNRLANTSGYFRKTVGTIIFLVIVGIFSLNFIFKQAYQLYDKEGKSTSYEALLIKAAEADIILFGELHDNPICHWLQLELSKDLYEKKKADLVLGAEMFESDNQLLIDEYLSGKISEKSFQDEAKLWNNFKTDYKPLLKFAKENKLAFVASNVPRRYASMVYRGGFDILDSLSIDAKKLIAPMPVAYNPELKGYKDMLAMAGAHGGGNGASNLPKAQAIKDATMAYFIGINQSAKKTLIHFNGTYHSNNFEGISWYLKKNNPAINIITIATVEQDEINDLSTDNKGLADYILTIPSSMTKTY